MTGEAHCADLFDLLLDCFAQAFELDQQNGPASMG